LIRLPISGNVKYANVVIYRVKRAECFPIDHSCGVVMSTETPMTFFGDAEAGERSPVIYSIIESCRRKGVETYIYLCDVLSACPP
jgi:hypothetical protein